jgi:hypothetical protein
MSSKDAAFVVAVNFALCSAPDSPDVDWSKIPIYSNEKDDGAAHWCEKAPFTSIFAQVSPPAADVQRYCSALLLPLLRASHVLGSELLATKIESHFVKGELPAVALLPSVILALGPGLKVTAVDVALVLVMHVLPLVKGVVGKLYVCHLPPRAHPPCSLIFSCRCCGCCMASWRAKRSRRRRTLPLSRSHPCPTVNV